ncbi:MAG: c-type cytochrome [Flavobacteriales bacterium]
MKSGNNPLPKVQNQRSKSYKLLSFFAIVFLSLQTFATIHEGGDYDAGESVFNNNCATCHSLDGSVLAAPSLKGVSGRWEGKDELINTWIKNPKKAFATGDAYVVGMANKWTPQFGWMQNQAVNDEDIKNVLTYVSEYVPPVVVSSAGEKDWYNTTPEEAGDDNPIFWYLILAVIFAIIAVAASGAGRAIGSSIQERETGAGIAHTSYGDRVKGWLWDNKAFASILTFVIVIFFLIPWGYNLGMAINIMEGHMPEQPIAFNHKLHAGKNGINCEYCHNSASKSKHAGLPEPMLCMNCHKGVKKGHNDEMTAEIQKIYDYVGFDPEAGTYIADYDQQPITWNKVHNLPDHVYFNHSQHVNVAGLACQQCHGPVDQEYMLGKVATSEEIMKLAEEDVSIISLEKDVLTMGWCIECHNKAGISVMNTENGYYQEIHDRLIETDLGKRDLKKYLEDNVITVKELGGWECSKCHY